MAHLEFTCANISLNTTPISMKTPFALSSWKPYAFDAVSCHGNSKGGARAFDVVATRTAANFLVGSDMAENRSRFSI